MIVALIEHDNIGGLARPAEGPACAGFQQIAWLAWQTAIKEIINRQVKCFLLISNISHAFLVLNILLISNSFADNPTSYGTLHPNYCLELQVILSQYYKKMFSCKGASGVATP